jgi:hypothetical protein
VIRPCGFIIACVNTIPPFDHSSRPMKKVTKDESLVTGCSKPL